MDRATRRELVRRGFKDPVVAYRAHAVGAAERGIEFKLTFAQWWELWEPHYEQRGRNTGQKVMCRTGDAGAYEVGNVRIDTVAGNGAERGEVYRKRQLAANRVPAVERRHIPGGPADWMNRKNVFVPYTEDEESYL